MENDRKRRAFFSVWHKEGIVEFARGLAELGWEIEASGGTCKHLRAAGLECLDLGDRVGEPIFGHRVVTLSREFHAGLLMQNTEEDWAELSLINGQRAACGQPAIAFIDLLCCDFYPLAEEIAKPGATAAGVIEKTDIGGPTMVRAAAKGRRMVVCDPADRAPLLAWIRRLTKAVDGRLELYEEEEEEWWRFREALCAKAEAVVAGYCGVSAVYHGAGTYAGGYGARVSPCKYGENPSLAPAALYAEDDADPLALHRFRVVDGDAPSYINWTDVHRLLDVVTQIAASCDINHGEVPAIAVGAKHGNACGASHAGDVGAAIRGMLDGDRLAIFGGLVMLNRPVGVAEAELLRRHGIGDGPKRLLDGVISPSFSEEAVAVLGRKGGKCRCIANPALAELSRGSLDRSPRLRPVRGGFLMQPADAFVLDWQDPRIVVHGFLSDADRTNISLARAVGARSNSNTITLVRQGMVIANAVGQQDRVGAAQLALMRAKRNGHDTRGATAYSDSFFPFPDGPTVLIEAGIRTIFASSGSVKDAEVVAVCKAAGVTLVMMPDKDCRGFYGH